MELIRYYNTIGRVAFSN